jgi:hypothetical protein
MSRMKPKDAIGAKARPFTGAEYLASLRDGREVYIYGDRVIALAEQCLAEYDENGWEGGTWLDPG